MHGVGAARYSPPLSCIGIRREGRKNSAKFQSSNGSTDEGPYSDEVSAPVRGVRYGFLWRTGLFFAALALLYANFFPAPDFTEAEALEDLLFRYAVFEDLEVFLFANALVFARLDEIFEAFLLLVALVETELSLDSLLSARAPTTGDAAPGCLYVTVGPRFEAWPATRLPAVRAKQDTTRKDTINRNLGMASFLPDVRILVTIANKRIFVNKLSSLGFSGIFGAETVSGSRSQAQQTVSSWASGLRCHPRRRRLLGGCDPKAELRGKAEP